MNAPAIKQIIRLVMAKRSMPIELAICALIPVAPKESTIAAQMLEANNGCSNKKEHCSLWVTEWMV